MGMITALLSCLLGVVAIDLATSQCVSCRNISMKEDVDWYRMNDIKKPWYDVLDMPGRYAPVECWNNYRFTPVEDGVVAEISAWSLGGNETKSFIMHYIRVEGRTGIYRVSHEHKEHFVNQTIKAAGRKVNDDVITEINQMANSLFAAEFYFLTDYKNYYIPGICGEDGSWMAFIKFRHQLPTNQDLVRLWNVMIEHGICGKLFLKETCIHREYTDQCF